MFQILQEIGVVIYIEKSNCILNLQFSFQSLCILEENENLIFTGKEIFENKYKQGHV